MPLQRILCLPFSLKTVQAEIGNYFCAEAMYLCTARYLWNKTFHHSQFFAADECNVLMNITWSWRNSFWFQHLVSYGEFYQVCLERLFGHYLNAICCRCRKLQILFHDCLTNGAKPRNVFQEKSLLAPVSALWFSSCRTLYTHLPLLTFPQRWVSFRTVAFMTLMFPMTTEIFGYDVFMDAETAAEFC